MNDRSSPGTCRSKFGRLLHVRPCTSRIFTGAAGPPARARCQTATWCPSTTTSCLIGRCWVWARAVAGITESAAAATQTSAPFTTSPPLFAQDPGAQRVERVRRAGEQFVREPVRVREHARIDHVALIQVQSHPRQELQAQVAIAVDRRVREPRLEILRAPR